MPDPLDVVSPGLVLGPMRCKLCGLLWERPTQPTPPCNNFLGHTLEEWETFYTTQPDGPNKRQRWIDESGVPLPEPEA
jgi:hypothetical protein